MKHFTQSLVRTTLAVFLLIAGAHLAHAGASKWFQKRDFQMSGASLAEVAAYLTSVSGLQVEADSAVAQLKTGHISIKNQSPSEFVDVLAAAHGLAIEKVFGDRGYRLKAAVPGQSLHLLDNLDAGGYLSNLSFVNATAGEAIGYVAEVSGLSIMMPEFSREHLVTFSGGIEAYAFLNEIAKQQKLSVYEQNGVIYFKKP